MKAFLTSLAILIAMTSAIILNMFYVNRVTENLFLKIQEMPQDVVCSQEQFDELLKYWNKHVKFMQISSAIEHTRDISKNILQIGASVTSDDYADYVNAKTLLKESIQHYSSSEKLSWENLA